MLYMVWPSTSRFQDFDGVALSYRDAARDVGGILCPAGETWRAAWKRDPKLALYSPDGLHPTPAGTYAAAVTFFQVLYKQSPVGLPASLTLAERRDGRDPRGGSAGSPGGGRRHGRANFGDAVP